MTSPTPSRNRTVAGGAPIAIATLIGAVVGTARGEPTMGVLIGFGIGAAIALLIWALNRRS